MRMSRLLAGLLVMVAAAGCTTTPMPLPKAPVPSSALSAKLLTEADLPSGYRSAPLPSLGSSVTSVQGCPALSVKPAGTKLEASVAFSGGTLGSFITETIRELPDADATKALDDLAEAVKTCASFSAETAGIKVEFTSADGGLPSVGERTVSIRLAAKAAGVGIVVDEYLVGIKSGPLLIVVAVVGPGQVDRAVVEAVMRKAWQKAAA